MNKSHPNHQRLNALEKMVKELREGFRKIVELEAGAGGEVLIAQEMLELKPYGGLKNRNLDRYVEIEMHPKFSHRCPDTGHALDKDDKRFASHILPQPAQGPEARRQPKRWETELKDFPLADEQLFDLAERMGMDRLMDSLSSRILTVSRQRESRWVRIGKNLGMSPDRIKYLAKRLEIK